MNKRAIKRYLLSASMAGVLASVCMNANASAFQLFEYNGVNVGNFGAGAAAIANDASTAFSNPAGMVLIPNQQIVLSTNAIITDIKFKGTETWAMSSFGSPPQHGTAQGGGTKYVPAFHYVTPLADNWAFGFSVSAPFGLVTNYGDNSLVNYSATDSQLETIDLSPSLAFKVNDKLSIGAGFDAEHLDATLNGTVGIPIISPALNTQSTNKGSAWGYGWHAGVLYQFTPHTRVGLAYHSQVHFDVTGTSKLTGPLANQANVNEPGVSSNNSLETNVTLPPWTELSGYHDINQQWSIDGSLVYTQWSFFNDELHIQNVQGVAATIPLSYPQIVVNMPNHFRNTWRVAVGANYRPADKWILRAGAGYDQSPVKDAYRGVRLPDSDRYAIAFGAHYQAIKTLGVDVGWTHLFVKEAKVNLDAQSGSQDAITNGKFYNHADIIGAQLTWDIT